VSDASAPTLSGVPADVTVTCDNIPAVASPSASDVCDATPAITFAETSTKGTDPDQASFYNYEITRTWTATDAAGNSSSQSQKITVSDASAPTLSGVPADVTVTCDNIPAVASPSASDVC
ncbi:hypothetical protein ACNKXV_13545, partial [Christiangramia aquimixticola]